MSANSKANNTLLQRSLEKRGFTFGIGVAIIYAIWTLVVFFASAAITSIVLSLLSKVGVPIKTLPAALLQSIFSVAVYLLTLIIVIGVPYLLAKSKTTLVQLGVNRVLSWADIGLGLVGFIPYIAIKILLVTVVALLFSGYDGNQVQDIGFSTVSSQGNMILAFITLVIVAPVAEEIVFRGYLYGKVKKYIGTIGATLLVSACFGLVHLQPNLIVDTFALGVILCVLRELTGSIWAGVILHMIKNGIAFYVLFIANIL